VHAGKLSFPVIDARLRGRTGESRVAAGDERSELALDAAGRARNLILLSNGEHYEVLSATVGAAVGLPILAERFDVTCR